jgi:PAS domain S-box-containing protein
MSASNLEFPTTEARVLIDSEEWLKTLSNSIPALIWCSEASGLCTYFNNRWLQFTGRTMQESLGNGWAEDVHPDDTDRVVRDYYRFLQLRQEFRLEYRLRYQGGPYKWIVDFGAPVFDRNRTFLGYIGGCTDVTMTKGSGFATSWREKHEAAVHAGLCQLAERIWAAEVAIRDLLDATPDQRERESLNEGLRTLLDMKRKKLGIE